MTDRFDEIPAFCRCVDLAGKFYTTTVSRLKWKGWGNSLAAARGRAVFGAEKFVRPVVEKLTNAARSR